MEMLPKGTRLMFRGLRHGNSGLAGVGAVLAAFGLLRRINRPKRKLLWAKTLAPGEVFRIRVVETGEEIEVEG